MVQNKLVVIEEREVLGKEFRIYGTVDDPLFLAKDVAEMIDYTKTGKGSYDISKMLNTVDEEEKLVRKMFVSGQNRQVWFLTEDGLYEVLMQSRKPIAKQFKKEVKAILKTIRKHGAYISENADVDYVNNELRFSEKRTIKTFADCKTSDEAEKLYEDFKAYVDKEYKSDTNTRIARYKSVEKGLTRLHDDFAKNTRNIGHCYLILALREKVELDRTTIEKRVSGGIRADLKKKLQSVSQNIIA